MKSGPSLSSLARYEFRLQIRNKWVWAFVLLFSGLSVGISYYGLAFLGYEAGFQDFYRTSASLLNLILLVVPLAALVAGHQSIVAEGAYLEFLAAQPVSRPQILLGKLLGLFGVLGLTLILGLSAGGIIIAWKVETTGLWRYLVLVGVSLVLLAVFLSLSALLSILSKRRAMAIISGLLLWFFFLVIYDALVLTASYYIEEAYLRPLLYYSLLGNPISIARVLVLLAIGGEAALGVAGAGLLRTYGGPVTAALGSVALFGLWIAAPLALAIYLFKRQDL